MSQVSSNAKRCSYPGSELPCGGKHYPGRRKKVLLRGGTKSYSGEGKSNSEGNISLNCTLWKIIYRGRKKLRKREDEIMLLKRLREENYTLGDVLLCGRRHYPAGKNWQRNRTCK